MMYPYPLVPRFLTLVFTFLLLSVSVNFAQSALFSVPTGELIGEHSVYIEADFDAHLAKRSSGGWQSYGFSSIYGTGKRSEVGLNVYWIRGSDSSAVTEFQPNYKYRLYNSETRGISVAAGAIAYIPGTGRTLHGSIVSAYVVASKRLRGARSPKLTAGAYQMVGATGGEATRGLLFGVEQPLTRRVTFVSDWNTGRNRLGYAAAGLGTSIGSRSYLYAAYYFGNEGRGNNSVGIYYGRSF
jgi:hypothetical protein